MKAFLFNKLEKYDTRHGACVIAETKEQATEIYHKKVTKNKSYEIDEIEIENGTVLKASGHDSVRINDYSQEEAGDDEFDW